MVMCEQHQIEHTPRFPCEMYERYREMSTRASSITEHTTQVIESPDGDLLGVERIEGKTLTADEIWHDDDAQDDS